MYVSFNIGMCILYHLGGRALLNHETLKALKAKNFELASSLFRKACQNSNICPHPNTKPYCPIECLQVNILYNSLTHKDQEWVEIVTSFKQWSAEQLDNINS